MVTVQNKNFSALQICMSGQCFRMNICGENKYRLVAAGRYLEITQQEDKISFDCTQEEYDKIWDAYFDMETDYEKVIASIDREDSYLMAVAAYGKGIRILQQDLWEMIISFIISQQNNIKRIRKCIELLCEKYGEKKISANGVAYFDFPTPKALANASVADLRACNLGYRSKYICQTANAVYHGDIDLEKIRAMEYDAAKKELLKLYGVGAKVADCICLFALHKTDAFPRDTHINKVMEAQYPNGFPFEKYGENSGILQQYIFYYDLENKKYMNNI
ncbi:MAG: 8-oxoguanine DNA glycosylase [Lachnospiraceae bacterium]|nr:8-oxoguanine DNA glycosylase [Lachnospiraceae bacterium]